MIRILGTMLVLACFTGGVQAGQVEIVQVEMAKGGNGAWRADVTLRHEDTGWEHYADAWRVVTADGTVLGTRVLHHPHVKEQPFTRSLGGINIPQGVDRVSVEAHDKVHGWNPQKVEVDLTRSSGDRYTVRR